MKVVVDTNVLVSGILNPHGYPGQVVDMILRTSITLQIDDRILAEYREVLLSRDLPLSPVDVALVLNAIDKHAEFVDAQPSVQRLVDPDDQAFLDVSHAADDAAIITGNLKHFHGVKQAMSPRSFIEKRNVSTT